MTCTPVDVDAVLLPPCLLSIRQDSDLEEGHHLLDFHPALHVLQHHNERLSCAEEKSAGSLISSVATVPFLSACGLPSSHVMTRLDTVH
jgi:hypothetical protein